MQISNTVGVFRLQLFKQSEVFIAQQSESLTRYQPVYLGRKVFGTAPLRSEVVTTKGVGKYQADIAMVSGSPKVFVRGLRHKKLDIIHAHFGIDAIYALRLARALRLPLVTTLHGFDVTTKISSFLTSGRPALVHYFFGISELQKRGGLFICVSEYIKKQAILQGFPEDRCVVHYMGTKLPTTERRDNISPPLIVHVARLVEKKGTAYLIEAAAILASRGIKFSLEILGEGPSRASLERQVAELRLSDKVIFRGFVPHATVMERLYLASVLALPSVRARNGDAEGLGMVLLEASALGVPVVGSTSGGIPEAVIDGSTGFLVPERDAVALADKLAKILEDPNLQYRLGEGGRMLTKTKFDVSRQTVELENLYDRVRRDAQVEF